MTFKLKSLIALFALAVFATDRSQAAGGGEHITINHKISPENSNYTWPNKDEPGKTLFPGYTFTFNIEVENTEVSGYKLAHGYPKVSPIDHPSATWVIDGTNCSILNAALDPVSVSITVEALWVLKDPVKGGSGSGSSGSIPGSATANVRLANSDVVWEIPEPVVVIPSPEFGDLFFETRVIDTDGNPLPNAVFNAYDVVEADPQNANWQIIDLGAAGPNGHHGLVRCKERVKSKIQITYNDGNVETRKSKEIRLASVEIVDKDKDLVTELKVGKMAEAGVLSGIGTLNIDYDTDRFFIRIPGAASLGTSTVQLETVENPDTTYNDNATEIELTVQGGDLISKSLLLVSDDVDDDFPVDGIADDAPKDRTHKIQLEGKVKISAIKIGTNAELTVDMKVPLNVKKTIKIKMVNCRYGLLNVESCWPAGTVTRIKKVMKERYAQVGIKLEITDAVGPVIDWYVGYVDNYPQLIGGVIDIPQQSKDIFNAAPVSSSDEVGIYLIRRLGGAGSPHGCSTVPKYMTPADKTDGYANKAFVGLPGIRADSTDYTLPHELLHVLLNAQHSDYRIEFADKNMLWHRSIQNNTVDDTKRISPKQETESHANPLAK